MVQEPPCQDDILLCQRVITWPIYTAAMNGKLSSHQYVFAYLQSLVGRALPKGMVTKSTPDVQQICPMHWGIFSCHSTSPNVQFFDFEMFSAHYCICNGH